MIRLALLGMVAVVLPALMVGIASHVLLRRAGGLGTHSRILISTVVALGFVVGVGTSNALDGSGVVLMATTAFAAVSAFFRRTDVRHRVIIACFVTVATVGSIQITAIDGFHGSLCSVILGDHTAYGPRYSTAGFKSITQGMTAQEVEKLVGRPLDEWMIPGDVGHVYWRWTRGRDGSHYYRYRVTRFQHGQVDEKIAFFYCDLD